MNNSISPSGDRDLDYGPVGKNSHQCLFPQTNSGYHYAFLLKSDVSSSKGQIQQGHVNMTQQILFSGLNLANSSSLGINDHNEEEEATNDEVMSTS